MIILKLIAIAILVIIIAGFIKTDTPTRIRFLILLTSFVVLFTLKCTLFMYLFGHCTGCSMETTMDLSRTENALAIGIDAGDATFFGTILSSVITGISIYKHRKKAQIKENRVITIVTFITMVVTFIAINWLTNLG